MEEAYRKNPDSGARGLVSPTIDFLKQREGFVGMYAKKPVFRYGAS